VSAREEVFGQLSQGALVQAGEDVHPHAQWWPPGHGYVEEDEGALR